VHIPAVPYALVLDGGVGYVPLQRFNASAAAEVASALVRLGREGARSFVVDVRGNTGGDMDQSLAISELFLKQGQELASLRWRGDSVDRYAARRPALVPDAPVVVLTDGSTASASEIVAGSLQDHDRALVIGTPSYGKGLVQSLYPLDGGWALKLTTAKWYTPSGRSIQRERLADGRPVAIADSARPVFRSDGGRPVLATARVARAIAARDAFQRGLPTGVGLELISLSMGDEQRFAQFIVRIARRAERDVVVGAAPQRLEELTSALAGVGYCTSGVTDAPALVSRAGSGRAPDLVILDSSLADNDPGEVQAVRKALAVRQVPTITLDGDSPTATREWVDGALLH
jgi:hypothetical protein